MPYYAHIRQDENGETIYQTVAEHLTGTAALCREFAADFGAEADGDLMGLAHDLGKCTDAFQKRLLEGGPVVDHTTAGMLTCIRMKRPSAAACVAGHHGGLLDVGNLRTDRAGEATLSGRFKKGVEGHYLERCGESGVTLPTLPPETPERDPLKASFRTRMLYSCLVDADFLDTERFMDGERGRGGYDDLPTLLRRLKEYIAPWQNPKTALNKLRCKILNSCLDTGSKPKGIYTLTVPTGGGKTVASLAFALRHAVAHGMKRVIYVVPYTSIIEQNAEVFREILGDGNVLEHHSGVQFELSDGASPEEVRRALAAENWDMPVIVTTAVQFFESIYANRSSKCRKLHNLADSVIIFDEAQMLPLCHLRPCVAAMASLAEQFRSTLVLCTATQPSLGDLLHTYAPSYPITELCPQTAEEYDSFRRVTFRQEGILEDDVLAEKLSEHRQVLCIVNSRKAAQSIFARLPQEASFHLSTLMVPAQRQTLLDEIRRRLKAGEPCRVVSTSLIEAGVDVDFPAVYRELAGLYVLGILFGILSALVLKSAFRGRPVPFVMELPNYRLPSLKSVALLLWDKAKDFIERAFTVIFLATIVIWFLQSFDARLNVVTSSEQSLLAIIGRWLAPIFAPLGFADWRCATALISGFIAKESVVSTLQILLGASAVSTLFTTKTALSFLVFTLLYTPCVAAIAAIRREVGSAPRAALIALTQCCVAWLAAFVLYQLVLIL